MLGARQQLVNLIQYLDIDYLLAPSSSFDSLVNLGTLAGLLPAELKEGSALSLSGLMSGVAAAILDGTNDYLDLNWEPEEHSEKITYFGVANLLNEDGVSQIFAWFWKFESGHEASLEMKLIKGTKGLEGQLFPFGVALRILTSKEIEMIFFILSEGFLIGWSERGVDTDTTLTGVRVEAHRSTGSEVQPVSTGILSPSS